MSVTREDLEMAAMAAGFEVVCTEAEMHGCDDASTIYTGVMLRGVQIPWRPHADIGEAARLAILLSMTVMLTVDGRAVAFISPGTCLAEVGHDGTEADKERAYCIAVTLCAEAKGRMMREFERWPKPKP